MPKFNVSLQVWILSRSVGTKRTAKRFLSSVDSFVYLQILCPWEVLEASPAGVPQEQSWLRAHHALHGQVCALLVNRRNSYLQGISAHRRLRWRFIRSATAGIEIELVTCAIELRICRAYNLHLQKISNRVVRFLRKSSSHVVGIRT